METAGSTMAGNLNALKHGACSPQIIGPRTQAIVDAWLDPETGLRFHEPVDIAAVFATAGAYARFAELSEWLESPDDRGKPRGAVDARGRPRAAMRLYYTAYRELMAGLKALGATPSGRADMAGAVAAVRNAQRAEAAQARLRARYGTSQPSETAGGPS